MSLCRIVVLIVRASLVVASLWVLGACASAPDGTPDRAESPGAQVVEPAPRTESQRILDDATLAEQEKAVFFQRRFAQAQALWRAQRLEEALEATEHALMLKPGDEQARQLRDRLRHDLGYRDGSVNTLLNDEADRYEATLDEERLVLQRLLVQAEKKKRNGNWDGARDDYERALFVLRTSKFREHDDYRTIWTEATRRANRLGEERAAAEKSQRDRKAAEALRELERQDRDDR